MKDCLSKWLWWGGGEEKKKEEEERKRFLKNYRSSCFITC
jgi:hypothetical protein